MNTKQIDYCIELAHTLNFSRAAENLFVSQPTFSYQIKLLEDEIGFSVFDRNGKGASLTPAGEQFVTFLSSMREELKRAIEQGQNFSAKFQDDISISLMVRQAVYFLPEAIRIFADIHPEVQISPKFQYSNGGLESFLKNETDILFALDELVNKIPGITIHKLFTSRIYLITMKNDPLAGKNIISEEDLYGRTLMVGGGSPSALRAVQQRLISSGKIRYFNSPDHDTTLINVASGRGVCLAPGFLNDHSDQFAWIPFDCKECFPCVLATHKQIIEKAFMILYPSLYNCIGKQSRFLCKRIAGTDGWSALAKRNNNDLYISYDSGRIPIFVHHIILLLVFIRLRKTRRFIATHVNN